MNCIYCESTRVRKSGIKRINSQRYYCNNCSKPFVLWPYKAKAIVSKKKSPKRAETILKKENSFIKQIPLKDLTLLERYKRKFNFYKDKVNLEAITKIKETHQEYRENNSLKLEIELVPGSCWGTNVRSNVKESEWDRIRFVTAGLADFKCEICGERGTKHPVECHEVWLYDEIEETQRLLKFQSICPLCHQTKHLGLSAFLNKYEQAYKRFRKVNNLTFTEADRYKDLAYLKFRERSRMSWKLDISILTHYHILPKF